MFWLMTIKEHNKLISENLASHNGDLRKISIKLHWATTLTPHIYHALFNEGSYFDWIIKDIDEILEAMEKLIKENEHLNTPEEPCETKWINETFVYIDDKIPSLANWIKINGENVPTLTEDCLNDDPDAKPIIQQQANKVVFLDVDGEITKTWYSMQECDKNTNYILVQNYTSDDWCHL